MSMYFHLRAVPPPALRNSATWFQRLFEDDWDTVRERIGRHREEVLDRQYAEFELLYSGIPPNRTPDGPCTQVVLGGRPVFPTDSALPPFQLLTASQVTEVAGFLRAADFDDLWRHARVRLLQPYDVPDPEPQVRGLFAATHRDLTAFYVRTAEYGDAVVKWLVR
ncbi:DUF1877 family protein [Streptomyces cyaneochromogenes]|uniref:DUF1877 family protein n=1 Tax=Streptomyces cyaneochromogenes TaxID=2496836 RepID=A0A3S9MCP7_9ACTN|nr:DUF1877 family protein [Streptomyces cyaneochromogenes]AZQ36955.1 DUF1877 family protein [Streptomyces cyaneochromogenes]